MFVVLVVGAVGLRLVSIVETGSGDLRFMLLSAVALLVLEAVVSTSVAVVVATGVGLRALGWSKLSE